MSKFHGIIPTLYNISDEDITAVIQAYRGAIGTKATDEELRPYAVNSLIGRSRHEAIQKIQESPALLSDLAGEK